MSARALVPQQSLSRPMPATPDRHPVAIYLASLAPGSRRTMSDALEKVARRVSGGSWREVASKGQRRDWVIDGGRLGALELPWPEVRYQHLQALRAELADRYAPSTANKMLAAVKGVLKACWRLELLDAETYHRAIDVASIKGTRVMRGRALELGEIRALAEVCKGHHQPTVGMRDAALIGLLYCAGLRRAEVVNIDIEDYDPDTGAVVVRKAKGNKERVVYASNGSKDALDAWLWERGEAAGPLFCPVNKAGRITIRKMTEQAIMYLLRRRAEDAGVKPFTPHDLRRTCASELWDAGVDGATIQQLLGHESMTTTARYDRRGERAKQQASEALYYPF